MSWRKWTDRDWKKTAENAGDKLVEWSNNPLYCFIGYVIGIVIFGRVFYHFAPGGRLDDDRAFCSFMMAVFWPVTVPGALAILLIIAIVKTFMFLIMV